MGELNAWAVKEELGFDPEMTRRINERNETTDGPQRLVRRVCYTSRIILNGTAMARYVDGFVIAVQKKKLAAYVRMAREGKRLWMKYGAIDYKECVADDVRPKGIVLTFPRLLRLKRGEVAVFSFIVYKSRAHRDQVTAKVMKDPSMASFAGAMPFDMKRMAMGGFTVAVDK